MASNEPVCIVPARGTSPGLPKKNFKQINQKPLVAYTIETATESECFSDVFVSTESEELADIAQEYGARVPFLRPTELSEEEAMLQPVICHTVDELRTQVDAVSVDAETPIVVLQPNIPFRRPDDIGRALSEYERLSAETLVSVVKENKFFWQKEDETLSPLFAERQQLREQVKPIFRETGSITVTSPAVLERGVWTGENPGYLVTDRLSSFEVRSIVDFWLAEHMAEGPTIVFRVDGGNEIGLGKIYRALTLATALEDALTCRIHFVSDSSYKGGIERLEEGAFEVSKVQSETGALETILKLDPDIVFVDIEKALDGHLDRLHKTSTAVLNLEDFGEGPNYADYVLNPQREPEGSVPANHLFGTDYFILRDEFAQVTPEIRPFAENVLITFGGSDPLGLSIDTVETLGEVDLPFHYKLVVGPDLKSESELVDVSETCLAQFDIERNVSNMGELMKWADIAISSGGRTVYELAATGTPSIVMAQNEGEVERMQLLRRQEAIDFLGHGNRVDLEMLPERLRELANDQQRRALMSKRGQQLVDGNGVQRILNLVHEILVG